MNRLAIAFLIGAAVAAGAVWMVKSSASPPVLPPRVVIHTPPPPLLPAPALPAVPPAERRVGGKPADPSSKPAKRVVRTPQALAIARVEPAPEASDAPAPSTPIPTINAIPPNLPDPPRPSAPAPPQRASGDTPAPEAIAAVPMEPRKVTLPAGTMITVRLRDTISTAQQSQDDPFLATLDSPLITNGLVIAERGTTQSGRIIELQRPGRAQGRGRLGLVLTQLTLSDGQTVPINTDTFLHESEPSAKSDAAKVGVLAGIGAAIGAIAGGGKGAAIGAGIGAAGGAGTVLGTRGKDARLESETRLTFRLKEPVPITEKIVPPKVTN